MSGAVSAQNRTKNNRANKRLVVANISERKITTETYNTLKWIAMITMTFHHLAYVLLKGNIISSTDYVACNIIGRIAFPLYCFLLVECYYFTENKTRHLIRLLLLAVVSEIPWDYMSSGKVFNWQSQSVCITLFLGFFMLMAMDIPVGKTVKLFLPKADENSKTIKAFQKIISFDMFGIFALVAHLLKSDYSWYGMFFIVILRIAHNRKHRIIWTILGFAIFAMAQVNYDIIYLCCFLALPIILVVIKEKKTQKSNGCIGLHFLQAKPFLLISRYYYPVHLVLLALCRYILLLR